MASLLPGYEYDIFISYRQKDNKADNWVTEFVNALRAELDSTFKEDISIYFDKNPHDGLLETHSVDKSLEGKLKCLIFIPIISQTYCDPKSFAWQYEFCVFNRQAKEDSFGRDIKLGHGNVASRILPVKIHELDSTDNATLEKEIGGMLRAVEFIYSEPGVNRPLKADDKKEENLHKTTYRNQVNKTANAVKEILNALLQRQTTPFERQLNRRFDGAKPIKRKVAVISAALVVIAVIAQLAYTGIKYSNRPEDDEKAIAVIPFENISSDTEMESFCDGMTGEIINHLSKISSLKVTSRTSVKGFKQTREPVSEIAKKLSVNYILTGSIRKSGNRIRIAAELIDTKTEKQKWSEDFDYVELKDIFAVESDVSSKVAKALKSRLTTRDNESLAKNYTENIAAYKYYLRGRNFWDRRTPVDYDSAESNFKKAVDVDPQYALAYSGLADCYAHSNSKKLTQVDAVPIAKAYVLKALAIDSTLVEAITTLGFIQSHFDYHWQAGEKTLRRAIKLNPNYTFSHIYLSNVLLFNGNKSGLVEVKKAIELDPLSPSVNFVFGRALFLAGELDSAILHCERVVKLYPHYPLIRTILALAYLEKKEFQKASSVIEAMPEQPFIVERKLLFEAMLDVLTGRKEQSEKIIVNNPLSSSSDWSDYRTAQIWTLLGNEERAVECLERAYNRREITMIFLYIDRLFLPLKKNKRFRALLLKMNFREGKQPGA